MSGESPFTRYWGQYCSLKSAAVIARWGNRGLFVHDENINDFCRPDSEITKEEADRAFLEELDQATHQRPSERPAPINSVHRLRAFCLEAIPDLEAIAKWRGLLENPRWREFIWEGEMLHAFTAYSPDDLIRELLALVRALPIENRQPFPETPLPPLTIDKAIFAMQRVVEWCDAAANVVSQPQPITRIEAAKLVGLTKPKSLSTRMGEARKRGNPPPNAIRPGVWDYRLYRPWLVSEWPDREGKFPEKWPPPKLP